MQEDIRIEWLNRKPFVFAVFSCRNHAHSVGVWTVETQLPTSGSGLGTPKAGWKLGGWKRGPWNERCPCHHVIPQLCCTWETLKMRKWENLKNGKSQSVLVDKLIKWKEIVLSHKKKHSVSVVRSVFESRSIQMLQKMLQNWLEVELWSKWLKQKHIKSK